MLYSKMYIDWSLTHVLIYTVDRHYTNFAEAVLEPHHAMLLHRRSTTCAHTRTRDMSVGLAFSSPTCLRLSRPSSSGLNPVSNYTNLESSQFTPPLHFCGSPSADDHLACVPVHTDIFFLAALSVDEALPQAKRVAKVGLQGAQVAGKLAHHGDVLCAAALGVLVNWKLGAGCARDEVGELEFGGRRWWCQWFYGIV